MSTAPKTLTITDQHKLLDALRIRSGTRKQFDRGVRNYCIACFMLETGLRVGEVVGLVKRDVLFVGKPLTTLIVRTAIAKNHKERSIPISTRLTEAIVEYAARFDVFEGFKDDDFLFHNPGSAASLTTRQVERVIRAAGIFSLGRVVIPHMLRHTFASKLMRVTDIRTVQELMGHSSITSTQIYTHPDAEDKRRAIENAEQAESEDFNA